MSDTEELLLNDLKKYVSNTDRDIYTVSNIPEEVIAVIFAYVSRSPKSFRDNIGVVIDEEQLGQERASKFHEKWVLNYGHASVAEHAAVHIGIENVSRLFSSLLELSNEYLSFTEYSQRYQKPVKGDFYTPAELISHRELKSEFQDICNKQYDIYSQLNEKLYEFLKESVPTPDGMEERIHYRALEKAAFEDARYALNLATTTNLGMTGNARAIEDSLSILLSSRYKEVRDRSGEIKEEVKFSVPTLIKYANENDYIVSTRKSNEKLGNKYSENKRKDIEGCEVNIIKGQEVSEDQALRDIISAILFEHSDLSYKEITDQIKEKPAAELLPLFKNTVDNIRKYDNPLNVFKLVKYEAEFVISEACWHQLLRHRKVDWIYKEPSIANGVTVPPNVSASGTEGLLSDAIKLSEDYYKKLVSHGLEVPASYIVTNAHNRRLVGKFDLWELYHLINLRMSEGAQWDIKNVTTILSDKISGFHPNLVKPGLERIK
jgi:thymidylate synthase ThyX